MCSSIIEDGTYKNIYNLSEWETQKDWYNWLNSNRRKKINDVFKDVIEMESYDVLLPTGDDEVPLLYRFSKIPILKVENHLDYIQILFV